MLDPASADRLEWDITEALSGMGTLSPMQVAERILDVLYSNSDYVIDYLLPAPNKIARAIEAHRAHPKGWCGPSLSTVIPDVIRARKTNTCGPSWV